MLAPMRIRTLSAAVLVLGFVAIVAHAAAVHQYRDGTLGPCARLHLELMRRPPAVVLLVAEPMRGTGRG